MPLTQTALIDHLRRTTPLNGEATGDSTLFSSGLLDSVAMLDLIVYVEATAGIEIRPEDVTLDNFDTPDRIVRFVQAAA